MSDGARPASPARVHVVEANVPKSRSGRPGSVPFAYIPAFDGIRAIAVVGVLLFHAAVSWMPGGFLGVDAFFVLSGFLITSILLGDLGSSGRIGMRRFYAGRARRLLPALIAVLAFTAVLAVLFAHDAAARVREDSIAAIFYVTNWWNIVIDHSYFDATGRPPMLQHLWSLAVEEQFYLVWPTVALLAFRWGGRVGVRRVALAGVGASAVAMFALSVVLGMPGDRDPSRLYFGSDTHSMGILLGAVLATVWRPHRLPRHLGAGPKAALTAIGAAALGAMLVFFCTVGEDSALLYRGGFLVFSALAAVVVAVASHPALVTFKWLGWQPLRYLGTRSYGLYLWHWPVFMVLRPGIDIDWTGVPAIALQFGFTGLLAELSYRFVEMPVRRGAIGRQWARWRAGDLSLRTRRAVILQVGGLATAAAVGIGLWAIPAPSANDYLGGVTEVGAGELATPVDVGGSGGAGATVASASPRPEDTLRAPPGVTLSRAPITAIGDSVMLGARAETTAAMPKIRIDAAISRQTSAIAARVADRKKSGKLADVVVIHTGTNGPAYVSILEPMLQALDDRLRVVLVTNRAPESWVATSNQNIRGVAKDHPNVRIADWAAVAADKRAWFYADATHPNPDGARVYADLVAAAIDAP